MSQDPRVLGAALKRAKERAEKAEARVAELESRMRQLGGILGNIDEATMHHAARRVVEESKAWRSGEPWTGAIRQTPSVSNDQERSR